MDRTFALQESQGKLKPAAAGPHPPAAASPAAPLSSSGSCFCPTLQFAAQAIAAILLLARCMQRLRSLDAQEAELDKFFEEHKLRGTERSLLRAAWTELTSGPAGDVRAHVCLCA